MCQWIRVSERLPPIEPNAEHSSITVLLLEQHGYCYIGYYDYAFEQFLDQDNLETFSGVTHWATITPPGED